MSRSSLVLSVLCLFALPVAALPPAGGLTARIDGESYFGKAERPSVTVTLANAATTDVYLPRWQTPLMGIDKDLFDVRRDGVPVAYTGRLIKFARPRAEDYVLIPAGGSRSARVDLAAVYDMALQGEYSVRFRVELQDVLRDAAPVKVAGPGELASNTLVMAVDRDERLAPFLEKLAQLPGKAASTSFVGCSSGQQSTLGTARNNATSYSSNSVGYLDSHTWSNAGPRYTTWFGALDSGRYATVSDHFDSIVAAFQNAAITFDCSTCTQNYYAYVYSNQPYTIYLCNVFWQAPATGTDSKAGTLVHEMSHFNVVAGTNDNAYGQAACKKLAQKNPRKAVDNADSHEYFAENTPSQN